MSYGYGVVDGISLYVVDGSRTSMAGEPDFLFNLPVSILGTQFRICDLHALARIHHDFWKMGHSGMSWLLVEQLAWIEALRSKRSEYEV